MDAVISVIIPTLNEASRIGALLEALAREDTAHEVIVADGGSDDDTVTIARRLGASVLSTVGGVASNCSRVRPRHVAMFCCSCMLIACFQPVDWHGSPMR